jgi:ABC-2 type transport system ATP-binding protein
VTAVVEVQGVSKHFRLYHERHKSLKERLIHPGVGSYTDLTAVNDVSFSVDAAQTVGILGRNGSGKSTLLKCICGVLQPTAGKIIVRGSLAGLLELGAGFQTELSGRDNIYLSGSMLGLSRRQVDRLFDSIVDFSELEGFIDTQVKFYSSGMYVRLGFAVAVNVDPDVLIVDEVLAVGDERFQTKCMDRIRQFQQEGRTIMLVSHNADQVRSLCDRAIVLDHGNLLADGPSGESVKIFREALMGEGRMDDHLVEGDHHRDAVMIEAITTATGRFDARTGAPWSCDVAVTATEPLEGCFVIELHNMKGVLVSRSDPTTAPISLRPGNQRLGINFASLPLLDGTYEISVGIVSALGHGIVTWREQLATLEVSYEGRAAGIVPLQPTVTVY